MAAGITGYDEFGLPKITDDELSSRLNQLNQNFQNLFNNDLIGLNVAPPARAIPPLIPDQQLPSPPKNDKNKDESSSGSVGSVGSAGPSLQVNVYKTKPEKNSNAIKKWTREWMWDFLERQDLVLSHFPRPCFQDIPNFSNSNDAAIFFSKSKIFDSAKVVLVSSCPSLTFLRELLLKKGKILYTRVTNFQSDTIFTRVDPSVLKKPGDFVLASKTKGLKTFGKPVKCRIKSSIDPIDLMIVGSVAVNSDGARIGDGKGFEDMEWAVLYELGAVKKSTTIVTLVDSVQILDSKVLPNSIMEKHDIPVDVIITKKSSHYVKERLRKPEKGVLQHLLSKKQLSQYPALEYFI